jgi:PAP2 superfamily
MTNLAAPPSRTSSDSAAWLLLAVLLMLVAGVAWVAPMGFDPVGAATLVLACAALGAVTLFYRSVRRDPALATMCVALMQMLLFSAIGSILSYLLARHGGSLWDDRFIDWDRALGFDFLAYVRWVDRSALAAATLRFAYASLIPQIIAIVLVFGFTRRLEPLRSAMLAAMLCGTVTILLSPLFPATGNYVHLGLHATDFQRLDPAHAYAELVHIRALRDGTMTGLRFRELQGIITFPSYHAGLATVTLWSFARVEQATIRRIGIALASATILSTPVNGGHYLVDVIAGITIAGLAIAAAARCVAWQPDGAWLMASPFRRSHVASAP